MGGARADLDGQPSCILRRASLRHTCWCDLNACVSATFCRTFCASTASVCCRLATLVTDDVSGICAWWQVSETAREHSLRVGVQRSVVMAFLCSAMNLDADHLIAGRRCWLFALLALTNASAASSPMSQTRRSDSCVRHVAATTAATQTATDTLVAPWATFPRLRQGGPCACTPAHAHRGHAASGAVAVVARGFRRRLR